MSQGVELLVTHFKDCRNYCLKPNGSFKLYKLYNPLPCFPIPDQISDAIYSNSILYEGNKSIYILCYTPTYDIRLEKILWSSERTGNSTAGELTVRPGT